jgi:signal transduction histidine kinase/ActR/RegA family two-component response regulator
MTVKKAPYEFLTSPEDRLPEINLNWLTLVFEGENAHLEQDYLDNHAIGVLQIQRVGIFVGALMISTFGVMDLLVLEGALDTVLAVRYGVLVPATLLFLVHTFSSHFTRHVQGSVACMVTFMGFGLSAIILMAPVDTSPLYFAGNMLAIFFAYTFLGLRFVWANVAGWSIFIGFVGADYLLGKTAFEEQFMRANLTLSTCFLGMVVAYSSEFFSRRDFYLRNVLELRRVELESNRSDLEARVHERTGQALAAAKAKTDFLANMSHEIRTPMNGVLGMLELVQSSELSEDQKEKIDTAFNSAEGLLDIINGVLDLSKIEAGKMQIKKAAVSPALVIEDIASLLAPQFRAKNIQLINELSPESYDFYLMDSTRLRQVILNLVGNALKFTDQGTVKISCRAVGQMLTIDINDTGIGILDEQRKHLFDAFSQADNSSAREFGGTGLGLSISKQLTELMGGLITVESKFSVGSKFSLKFEVEPCVVKNESINYPNLFKNVFFVVESEQYSRSVRLMLKRLGCTISRLDDAEVAVSDMGSIDCGALPVVFLGDPTEPAINKTQGAVIQNLSIQRLSFPFTLSALASMLRNSHYKPAIDELQNSEKKFFKRRVLLVEDNVINQKVACSMLERLGVNADVAMNGQEAIRKFGLENYDLIFMDCQMPGMDGFETTVAIRAQERERSLSKTVIVALTANAMEGDKKRCLDSGMDDYMSKPISLPGLTQVLDRWSF